MTDRVMTEEELKREHLIQLIAGLLVQGLLRVAAQGFFHGEDRREPRHRQAGPVLNEGVAMHKVIDGPVNGRAG